MADKMNELAMDFLAEKVRKGECILFLGAAAHAPPSMESGFTYPEAGRPPIGRQLSKELAEASKFTETFGSESSTNLQRVSLHFEISRSRPQLVDEIKKLVLTGKQPSAALQALARLNFPLVITTNYDRLFERALEKADKEPFVSIYSPTEVATADYPGSVLDPDHPFLCKLHGDIQHPESIVITDEDYIQFVLRMGDKEATHPLPFTCKFYLQKWPTLFIGYSLLDYNLRLLFKTLRWRMDRANVPDMYSVDLSPDPLILEVWHSQRRYVKFIAQDIWSFVPELYRRVTGTEMP